MPAAFRRLCVETPDSSISSSSKKQPPSGGCVLKLRVADAAAEAGDAAAFRRLCVETQHPNIVGGGEISRLQAAVC